MNGSLLLLGLLGLALVWLARRGASERGPVLPHDPARLQFELRHALVAGRKIEAIKLYRQLHGTDLRFAKEAVERMLASGAVGPDTPLR